MRKVVLKMTTQKDPIEHQSEARTFGELKKELRQVKWSGMRVVERGTKTTYQMDDAVLPQGEFLLFLVPEKVKSGRKTSGGTEELSKPIDECSYNECRSHMSWLNRNKGAGLDMSGGTDDLKRELKKYYKDTPAGTSAPVAKKPVAKPAVKTEQPVKEELRETKSERKERKRKEKDERRSVKTKANTPADPIAAIEDKRQEMNKIIDEIVLGAIEAGPSANLVLQYTAKDLEKEIKEVRRALSGGKYSRVE